MAIYYNAAQTKKESEELTKSAVESLIFEFYHSATTVGY